MNGRSYFPTQFIDYSVDTKAKAIVCEDSDDNLDAEKPPAEIQPQIQLLQTGPVNIAELNLSEEERIDSVPEERKAIEVGEMVLMERSPLQESFH